MSYFSGGEAEKLGNNYEDNVLIYYYGQVIDGNYLAVMSESFDRTLGQGGDIYLYDNENKETVVQAKSRHGDDDAWSIDTLISKDIIKNACYHILQGRKFVLASTLSCIFLQDLISHANAFDNYANFFQAVIPNKQAAKLDKKMRGLLKLEEEIKKYFNGEDPILFYHNFSLQRFDDDLDNFVMLFQNSVRAVGGGRTAFQLLRHYAIKNKKLSQKIYGDELWRYLTDNGVQKYEIDGLYAIKRVIDLCVEYKENIKRRLIKNEVYPRKEFDTLKDKINDKDIVVVHGKAGTGKSGIVLQLCNYFDENDILYLPISLDAHLPEISTYQFGRQLSLTASPVDILAKLANQRQAYLIIDQLDAIRWTVAHSTSALEECYNADHPVLLFSAIDIICPIWNFDKRMVLDYLYKILKKDIRVIRGRMTCILLDHIVVEHSDRFYPIFESVINSGGEYMSDIGERIIYYYCYYNVYRDLVPIIVKAKSDMVFECCLRVINENCEVEKQDRAKKLLLSINEDSLEENYYPYLTDVLHRNDNKFTSKLLKKLRRLPRHEWHVLLSEINEFSSLENYSSLIFMLCNVAINQNSLTIYEINEFMGILVKLFTQLYDKKDNKGWRACLKKINLIYDTYVMDTLNVMTKIS